MQNKLPSIEFFLLYLSCFIIGSCAASAPVYTSYNKARNSYSRPASGAQQIESEIRARFANGEIKVDVYPLRGEGYIDLAVRISSKPKQWKSLQSWNRNRRFPQTGVPITVPFSYLNAAYRLAAIQRLFPNDKLMAAGWQHRVSYRGETMWFIAETFTGDGANYPALQKASGMKTGQALGLGNMVTIPLNVLSDEYSKKMIEHQDLTFEKGADGQLYALYELKAGEALYSSVVVRFTGRVEANDVNEMARKIMKLSGISDPTRIPTGYKIRIPFDDLSDDFLTGGAPDRVVKVARNKRGSRLHVILDPGHGGSDPGAMRSGITEDELAYDIMLRVKESLERNGATVHPTVVDPHSKSRPTDGNQLPNGRSEQLTTTPPYTIRDARINVNMRVYLVNAIYERLRRRGIKDDQIFFLSIHIDHLHPSMSGAMIYYPNAEERRRRFQVSGSVYRRYAESRNARIDFSDTMNRRAESYSYDFSRQLIDKFNQRGIPVHPYRPIRPFVYRKNQKWTPAVIRYSQVPTSILLEVTNMANRHDFNRIRDHRFRQRVAEAIAATILS
ncbi:MAG: N-acetylmuramoyl-L-alanine amidase [Deferribacteres bacterium]|nr:N-acetylmuramoyl-L-alanine amidase [candidate division KSB1 bacterium]MCB9511043.1 N-acetylmuramoyl-L-alanine amidase [Deferribacteres bacterium]